MEFARKSWTQISDIYRTMSPSSRLTLVLLCGMVVLSLGYLLFVSGEDDTTYVLNGLEFQSVDLANAERVLEAQGLTDFRIKGNRIAAPKSEMYRYNAALAEQGAVPDSYGASVEEDFEKATAGNPMESERTREYRRQKYLEVKLAKELSWWSSIDRAAININKKSGPSYFTRGSDVVASVNIRPAAGMAFGTRHADAVRKHLTRCVAGLTPANISVTDASRSRTFVASDDDMGGSTEHLYDKQKWEQSCSRKIQASLKQIAPGAVVGLNVTLGHDNEKAEELDIDGKDGAIIKERVRSREEKSGTGGRGREPGLEPNLKPLGGAELGGDAVAGIHSVEESESEQEKEYSRIRRVIQKPPGEVKEITVAVAVPHNYYEKAYKADKGADPDRGSDAWTAWKKECNVKIEKHVQGLIGDLPNRTVTVDSFPMIAEAPAAMELDAAPADIGSLASSYGRPITLGLLALVSLFMVRNVIRKSVVTQETETQEAGGIHEADAGDGDGALMGIEMDPEKLKTAKMTDQVQQMVQQNPDMAASLIKRWVGKEG